MAAWSSNALARVAAVGDVAVNPIVYAEISLGFDRIEDLDDALLGLHTARAAVRRGVPRRALLRALPRAGGARRSPLPDFYIGAHAAVAGLALLTRDATRFRTYFPQLGNRRAVTASRPR